MITFLTLPRAFTGEFDTLQRMAIRSWQECAPGCQVIAFGDEAGLAGAAADLGFAYRNELDYAAQHRPLVDKLFALGERYAVHDWLCYCSADVVLDGLQAAIAAVQGIARPFIVGRRWDIEPAAHASTATLHAPCGMDYFLYRRGTLGPVLPFVVGGGGGDQWLLWKALTAWQMTVVDATDTITAIHVNHSHPEWPNGKAGRQGSPEQAYNRALWEGDGMTALLDVTAAPWVLVNGHLRGKPAKSAGAL